MDIRLLAQIPPDIVLMMSVVFTALPVMGIVVILYAFRLNHLRAKMQEAEKRQAAQLAEERACRRIAKDLHASIGQALGLGQRLADRLDGRMQRYAPQEDIALLERLTGLLREGVQEVRLVTQVMHGGKLLEHGLLAGIRTNLDRLAASGGLAVTCTLPEREPGLPEEHKTLLYRSLQDSLNNVTRHAQATQVHVSLTVNGDVLTLAVRDDGVGFDPADLDGQASLGLHAVRQRAIGMGGRAAIRSAPGAGTTITVTISLDTNPDTDEDNTH